MYSLYLIFLVPQFFVYLQAYVTTPLHILVLYYLFLYLFLHIIHVYYSLCVHVVLC